MTAEALLVAQLTEALVPGMGPVDVVGLSRLKGGYSREMWSFDAITPAGTVPLILCANSAVGVVGDDPTLLGRVREAALLRHLHRAGLPVPDALVSGDADSVLGRPFFVMQRHPGTAAVGAFRRDEWYLAHVDDLAGQLATMLAGVHSIDVPATILGPCPAPADVAPAAVERWATELDATPDARSEPIDRAIGWLSDNLPLPPERVTAVHGDFRIGNVLHGRGGERPDGLWTILDWEMAHQGDPLEDVAWAQLVCWRVGTGRVGGLVPLDRWCALYAEAAGRVVDAAALRFWEVLGTIKMTCLIRRAAQVVDDERERALLRQLSAELLGELDHRLLVPSP
jgi:aminoglycoside phosphotransferase (APT) family kinase protein